MKRTNTHRNRREFLAAAGTLVAAPCIVPSTVFGDTAPSTRINTALIGSGSRGQQIIVGGDRVLAVCDVDSKHAETAKRAIDGKAGNTDCEIYRDFREVLTLDDIDAVVVGAPDHWHVPIAIAAVRAGKAVYVEKPVSLTIREGRVLADVAERYGAYLQVGSQQRSDFPDFLRACELVRNGRIGELKKIVVKILARPGTNNKPWTPQPVPQELDYDMWLGQAPWAPYHKDRCHYNFRFVTDCSGGDVTNWGAHQLDIAQWGMDADHTGPAKIVGMGKRNQAGLHDVFYDIQVKFLYRNGVSMELLGRKGDTANGVQFIGSEGQIWVDRTKIASEPKSVLTSKIRPDEIHLDPEFAGTQHMARWLEAIRTRKQSPINVPAEVGHRSATVCHLANIAMELPRQVLTWDPVKEEFVGNDQANSLTARTMREPWRI